MDDSSLSNHVTDNTPQATPLPNDSYRIHPVATDQHSNTNNLESNNIIKTKVTPQYSQDDDNDDDMPPPPLPMEPPPSSTSASSQNTNSDLDEIDSLPPESKMPHSVSNLSEDFHTENSDRIVEPPEGFLSSSPTKDHIFTVVSDFFESGKDEEDGIGTMSANRSPRLSPSKDDNSSSFRRVRSNPSLSTLKVKMSVISSTGNPVSSLTNLEMSGVNKQNSTNSYNVAAAHSQLKS